MVGQGYLNNLVTTARAFTLAAFWLQTLRQWQAMWVHMTSNQVRYIDDDCLIFGKERSSLSIRLTPFWLPFPGSLTLNPAGGSIKYLVRN